MFDRSGLDVDGCGLAVDGCSAGEHAHDGWMGDEQGQVNCPLGRNPARGRSRECAMVIGASWTQLPRPSRNNRLSSPFYSRLARLCFALPWIATAKFLRFDICDHRHF